MTPEYKAKLTTQWNNLKTAPLWFALAPDSTPVPSLMLSPKKAEVSKEGFGKLMAKEDPILKLKSIVIGQVDVVDGKVQFAINTAASNKTLAPDAFVKAWKAVAAVPGLNALSKGVDKATFLGARQAGKGAVIDLDNDDKTIRESSERLAKARTLGMDAPIRREGDDYAEAEEHHEEKPKVKRTLLDKMLGRKKDAPKDELKDIGDDSPVVLLGHGTPSKTWESNSKVYASEFADMTPAQVITYLTSKLKLPKTYAGKVYLDGCYTAAGATPQNFAFTVYRGLVAKGYPYLQVVGNLGLAVTLVDGKEEVVDAQDDPSDRIEKLEAALKKLEKPATDAQDLTVSTTVKLRKLAKAENRPLSEKENLVLKKLNDDYEKKKSAVKKKGDAVREELTKLREKKKGMTFKEFKGTFGPEKLRPET